MAVDDEIWRPGYDGPPPVPDVAPPDSAGVRRRRTGTEDSVPAESSTRAERVATARSPIGPDRVAVVLSVAFTLAVTALIVRSFVDDDLTADVSSAPPEPATVLAEELAEVGVVPLVAEPFAGADARRLPRRLDELWRTDLTGVSANSRTRLSVLADGAVVGLFDAVDDDGLDDGGDSSVLVLLDGIDGAQRWSRLFDGATRAFDVLGDVGDVIVVERRDGERRAVMGISVETGGMSWLRETNGLVASTILEGTELVLQTSTDRELVFIDPRTGLEVDRMTGSLVATDHLGTWYLSDGATVSALDLGDGWTAPVPLETLWVDDGEPVSVVDGRVVVIEDGILQIRGDGGYPVRELTVGSGGLDSDANFTQLIPMVGDSFVIVGSQATFGAAFDETGDVDIRWRAEGTVIDSRPTDRGLSLILATDGGGSQRVVDASTGREIAMVEMLPGSIETLALVGNGIVVKKSALVGVERVGLDLDGNRLWSLAGEGPVAVGPSVVATFRPSDAGVAVTALGESPP